MEANGKEAQQAPDRRAQPRVAVEAIATVYLLKVACALRGQILDLSLGGCRIRTLQPFPVGIYCRVELEFTLSGIPFRLAGVTQSIHDRHTAGFRFLDLSERKREQLMQLIQEIQSIIAQEGSASAVLPDDRIRRDSRSKSGD
jgi:c-di-GMP-binding flagellar brake protein YcgR